MEVLLDDGLTEHIELPAIRRPPDLAFVQVQAADDEAAGAAEETTHDAQNHGLIPLVLLLDQHAARRNVGRRLDHHSSGRLHLRCTHHHRLRGYLRIVWIHFGEKRITGGGMIHGHVHLAGGLLQPASRARDHDGGDAVAVLDHGFTLIGQIRGVATSHTAGRHADPGELLASTRWQVETIAGVQNEAASFEGR